MLAEESLSLCLYAHCLSMSIPIKVVRSSRAWERSMDLIFSLASISLLTVNIASSHCPTQSVVSLLTCLRRFQVLLSCLLSSSPKQAGVQDSYSLLRPVEYLASFYRWELRTISTEGRGYTHIIQLGQVHLRQSAPNLPLRRNMIQSTSSVVFLAGFKRKSQL